MDDIFPKTRQRRWANNFLLDFDSINWLIIYKNNYCCTLEMKVRSFQIFSKDLSIATNAESLKY